MSTTAIRPFRSAHPDAVRIVALSAAISLNAAMLLMALRPLAANLLVAAPDRPLTVSFPSTPPVLPAVPAVQLKPLSKPLAVPTPVPIVAVPTVLEPDANSTPARPAVSPVTVDVPVADDAGTAVSDTPAQTTLAYVDAPPPAYPAQARRLHMQGTVILRVLVDAQGRPLQVVVEHSSGHELLDRTASAQVLEHWRFRPAEANGRATRAWARVPVNFSLRRL